MSALQHFFDAERLRRGWSMRETAKHSRMSVSKAYAIVNGDDNVEFETFENIATAFNMTPAELATAIGKGSPVDDPDEAEMLALYRQIAAEQRPTVKSMLRGLPGMRPDSRLTRQRKGLGRSNQPEIHQTVTRRRHYQSKSVATMIAQYGLQPA